MQSARNFLKGIIDYAGLFPPASLSMEDAVRAYASYLDGSDRELVGRFIVPSTRLEEFSRTLQHVSSDSGDAWLVSVTTGREFAAGRDAALQLNASATAARCDALETIAASASEVRDILKESAPGFELYIEVPLDPDPVPVISAIAGSGAFAKVRTGGITQAAIPSAEEVLRFMLACRDAKVPFKATAGLHHVVRSEYPLTYDNGAPLGTMFGYLNIFLAAAAVDEQWDTAEVLEVLDQRDVSRFEFDDDGAVVNGHRLSNASLIAARSRFARSFGSCSFIEPVAEARAVGLL